MIRDEFEKVQSEIDDILPAYKRYSDEKTKFQHDDSSKENVLKYQNMVCREIFDLIKTLYSCSDMPLERVNVQNMIQAAYDDLCFH